MTAEVMTEVRTQGERADDVVSGIVDRMLGRDRWEVSGSTAGAVTMGLRVVGRRS